MKTLITQHFGVDKWIVVGCKVDGFRDYCASCIWNGHKKYPCKTASKTFTEDKP